MFPKPESARVAGGLRLDLVKHLHHGLEIAVCHPSEVDKLDAAGAFSSEVCAQTADLLRMAWSGQLPRDEESLAKVIAAVDMLAGMREHIRKMELECWTRKHYNISFLVDAVALSGLLKRSTEMHDALVMALRLVAREPRTFQAYMQVLNSKRSLPSPTTIIRHRLSVLMAGCRVQQLHLEALLSDTGITQWGTLDASPKGGHEWQMLGFSKVANKDLESAYLASMLLEIHSRQIQEPTCVLL